MFQKLIFIALLLLAPVVVPLQANGQDAVLLQPGDNTGDNTESTQLPSSKKKRVVIRRAFVDKENLNKVLEAKTESYRPMLIEKFDALQRLTQNQTSTPPSISRVVLMGNLVEQTPVGGEMFLFINKHSAKKGQLVIPGIDIGLSDARWVTQEQFEESLLRYQHSTISDKNQASQRHKKNTKQGQVERQQIALTGTSRGQFVVDVKRTGILQLRWRHPKQLPRTQDGSVSLLLKIPNAPVTQLYWTAPENQTLIGKNCLCEQIGVSKSGQTKATIWKVQVGHKQGSVTVPHHALTRELALQFVDFNKRQTAVGTKPGYIENLSYKIEPHQLRFSASFHVSGRDVFAENIEVKFPKGTSFVQDSNTSALVVDSTGSHSLTIHSKANANGECHFQISGITQIRLGQPVTLPRINLEGIQWRGTSALNVSVSPLLDVKSVDYTECTTPVITTVDNGVRNWSLQPQGPKYSIKLTCQRQQPNVNAESICRSRFELTGIHAVQQTLISVDRNALFSIEAKHATNWVIDSVEARYADEGPASEPIIESWKAINNSKAYRQIEIRFASPVLQKRRILLTTRGHRHLSSSSIRLEHLNILKFKSADSKSGVVFDFAPKIKANLQAFGQAISYSSLNREFINQDTIRQHFDPVLLAESRISHALQSTPNASQESTSIFLLNGIVSSASIAIKYDPDLQFMTDTLVQATVSGQAVKERCQIDCSPSSSSVSHLEVSLFGTDSAVKWKLENEPTINLVATKKSSSDIVRGDRIVTEQVWRLEIHPSIRKSFTIVATRTSDRRPQHPVSSVSIHAAKGQTQRTVIGADAGVHAEVEMMGVNAIPVDRATEQSFAQFLGAFRLPQHQAGKTIYVNEPQSHNIQRAWVDRLHVDYRATNKMSEIVARFYLHSYGLSSFEFRLPEQSQLRDVRIDGTVVPHTLLDNGQISIRLPTDHPEKLITVLFNCQHHPNRLITRLPIPIPTTSLPILDSHQSIYVADGWDLVQRWQPINYRSSLFAEMQDRLISGVMPSIFSRTDEDKLADLERRTKQHEEFLQYGEPLSQTGKQNMPEAKRKASHRSWFYGRGRVVHFTAPPQRSYSFVNVRVFELIRWILVLTSFCLGVITVQSHLRLLLLMGGMSVAVCVIVPILFAPLAAAVFWGITFAVLLRAIRYSVNFRSKTKQPLSFTRRSRAVTSAVVLFCFILVTTASHSQELTKNNNVAPAKHFEVIYSTDKNKEIAGDTVYVPTELHDLLVRRSAQKGNSQKRHSFRSIKYDFKLTRRGRNRAPEISAITVSMRFNVPRPGQSVPIPINANFVAPSSVRLNSVQQPLRFFENPKDGFFIDTADSGEQQLEFELTSLTFDQFRLTIPEVHDSTVVAHVAADASDEFVQQLRDGAIQVNGGQMEFTPATLSFTTDIGPSKTLDLSWQKKSSSIESSTLVVDEFVKAEFGRSGIFYDYLWICKNETVNDHSTLKIKLDPQFETLSSSTRLNVVNESNNLITLQFTKDGEGRMFAYLRLQTKEKQLIGIHNAPQVKPFAAVSSNTLAIVSNEDVDIATVKSKMIMSGTLEAFLDTWKGFFAEAIAPKTVKSVVYTNSMEADEQFRVSQSKVQCTIQSRTDFLLRLRSADFHSEINLERSSEEQCEINFMLPSGYNIKHVNFPDGKQHPCFIEQERCKVLLQPHGGKSIRLQLTGITPYRTKVNLPFLSITGAEIQQQTIRAFRKFNVTVNNKDIQAFITKQPHFTTPTDLTFTQGTGSNLQLSESQHLFTHVVTELTSLPTIRVRRKSAARKGSLVLTPLQGKKDDNSVMFTCNIAGKPGTQLNALQLLVNRSIAELIEVNIDGELHLTDLPFPDQQQLLFVPRQPLKPGDRVEIKAKLAKTPSLLPSIHGTNFCSKGHFYVRLPKELNRVSVEWTQSGLAPFNASKNAHSIFGTEDNEQFKHFVIKHDNFTVQRVNEHIKTSQLQIPLLTTEITWSASQNFVGTCKLLLAPTDRTKLELETNDSLAIVRASLHGHVIPTKTFSSRTVIDVPASAYPRELSLEIRGRATPSQKKSDCNFKVVTPISVPAGQHIVRILMPEQINKLILDGPVESVHPGLLELTRLKACLDLLPLQVSTDFEAWKSHRLAFAQQQIESLRTMELPEDISVQLKDLLQRAEFEQISNTNLINDLPSKQIHTANSKSLTMNGRGVVWTGRITGGSNMVQLRFATESQTTMPLRILICLSILIGSVLVFRQASWHVIKRSVGSLVQPVGLLLLATLGVAWSTFVNPAFIGWLLIFTVICVGIRSLLTNRKPKRASVVNKETD